MESLRAHQNECWDPAFRHLGSSCHLAPLSEHLGKCFCFVSSAVSCCCIWRGAGRWVKSWAPATQVETLHGVPDLGLPQMIYSSGEKSACCFLITLIWGLNQCLEDSLSLSAFYTNGFRKTGMTLLTHHWFKWLNCFSSVRSYDSQTHALAITHARCPDGGAGSSVVTIWGMSLDHFTSPSLSPSSRSIFQIGTF